MNTQIVYLLCFSQPFKGVRHYLGSAISLSARMKHHERGTGARLLRAVRADGITWEVARTWEGGRKLERLLKNQKSHAQLCPNCRGARRAAINVWRRNRAAKRRNQ